LKTGNEKKLKNLLLFFIKCEKNNVMQEKMKERNGFE